MVSERTSCATCRLEFDSTAVFCPGCGTARADAPPSQTQAGQTIAERYRLIEKIGEGGSGEIYRAEHITLKRRVAVKILHERLSRDELAIERFRREATTVAELDNEHIVQILDFGRTADRRLYLAMEFLEGETLAARLADKGALPIEDVVAILKQLSQALMEAHAIGYVHRDLRPKNIFLSQRRGQRDFVKLLDFGLAKLVEPETGAASTSLGMTFGDPRYMSPEQAKGDPVDRRADLYSLGCIAYEMVSGRPIFDGPSMDVLQQQIQASVPDLPVQRADTPDWLNQLILRMLAKDPEQRFVTVYRLLQALEEGQATGAIMSEERARKVESTPPPSVTQAMARLADRQEKSWDDTNPRVSGWYRSAEGPGPAGIVSFADEQEYEEPKRGKSRAILVGGTLCGLVVLLAGLLYALPRKEEKPKTSLAAAAEASGNPPVIIVEKADQGTPDAAPVPDAAPAPTPPPTPPAPAPTPPPKEPKDPKPKKQTEKKIAPPPAPAPAPADNEKRQRAEYFAKLGLRALRSGATQEAKQNFDKARELDPQCAQALVGLGELSITQGSYREALAHLVEARQLAPGSARIETLIGQAYLKLGDKERAKQSFEDALRLDPNNARAQEGLQNVTGQ